MALAKPSKSKKLVRNPNTPSLKSQGAGYSTTNRKGETTFFKSSRDAGGYNDTTQSRSEMSKGTPMSKFDASGNVITAEKIKPSTPLAIPKPAPVQDLTSTTNGINSSLANASGGLSTYDPAKGFVTTPVQPDTAMSTFQQYLQAGAADFAEMGNSADRLAKIEKEAKLKQKEKTFSDLQNQINTITATRDAEQLALEGQGRGITESIIGGQQAQIGREAAIQALPLQAQLAAAQGDLESARSYVDRMFQVQSQDAQARYQYKSNLNTAIYGFLTAQEKKIADENIRKENRLWQTQDQNLAIANDWAKQAIEYGQSSLAGKIMALDSKSPTFLQDLSALQGQVRKPVAVDGVSVPTIKTINGVDYQWNEATGSWETPSVGGASVGAGGQSLDNLNTKYTELLKDIGDATKLTDEGGVGAGLIERGFKSLFVSNPDYKQLENIADTIKSNLLTLNTDPAIKKFFGPQMSNRDTELMTGAATTLNPDKQTPEQFKRDLQDAAGVIARARKAVRDGLGVGPAPVFQRNPNAINFPLSQQISSPVLTLAPDGTQIEIID